MKNQGNNFDEENIEEKDNQNNLLYEMTDEEIKYIRGELSFISELLLREWNSLVAYVDYEQKGNIDTQLSKSIQTMYSRVFGSENYTVTDNFMVDFAILDKTSSMLEKINNICIIAKDLYPSAYNKLMHMADMLTSINENIIPDEAYDEE